MTIKDMIGIFEIKDYFPKGSDNSPDFWNITASNNMNDMEMKNMTRKIIDMQRELRRNTSSVQEPDR